jgi:HK97 family phage portal protein
MPDNRLDKNANKWKIFASLAKWAGIPITLVNESAASDLNKALANAANSAGQTVNEATILSLSAAWACSKLVAQSISTLPLHLYERTDQGRKLAKDHPLYKVLHLSPNAKSTSSTFWGANLFSMLLRGNGWNRIQRNGLGQIIGLVFLHPDRLRPILDNYGRPTAFKYYVGSGQYETIPLSEIFYLPNASLDGIFGASTISYGASVFGSAIAANKAANETFKNGLLPTIAFKMEQAIKKEQRDDFKTAFAELAGALNSGKPIVLEKGMTAEPIGIDPKDAQLLESRTFSGEEVCRWFGVDPSLVGYGGKASNFGTGLEQKMIGFLTFTLNPLLTGIEQQINKNLLSPVDQLKYYAEFNIEGLLRADSTARVAFYSGMVNNGMMTRDEVRIKENLIEMGGNAAKLTIHSAMAPIDSLGEMATVAQAFMFSGKGEVSNEGGPTNEE